MIVRVRDPRHDLTPAERAELMAARKARGLPKYGSTRQRCRCGRWARSGKKQCEPCAAHQAAKDKKHRDHRAA